MQKRADNSSERDQRVMSIVELALRQDSSERDSYVRLACEQDDELYAEVSEIVNGEARMGSFLLHPMIVVPESPRPFALGQVVAQRFEIRREIGAGGMGIVYEAFDRKRRLRIALKAAKPGFQRLLTPELEAALTVRHPNICRANEIHTASTEQGDIDFLALEFLDGETLHARLNSGVAIAPAEALEIARQLCRALAEAHRCGVVHRDLKSANIFLCQDAGTLRAVITDFGLAGDPALAAGIGGTPDYMAPELWQGKPASIASDIYTLGVVLHELATGRLPDAAAGARTKLPARWKKAINACLDPAPQRRPAHASDVLALLDKGPTRLWALAALAVLLATPLGVPQVREWLWPSPPVRLVILPVVASGELVDTGSGILQDVSDRISRLGTGTRTIAIIPPDQVRDLQVKTPEQAGRVLHASHALLTSMRRDGTDLLVEATVIDLNTRVAIRALSGRYSAASLGSLPVAMLGTVSLALRVRGATSADALAANAVPPYDRGLHLLRRDDAGYAAAIPLFTQAALLDPRSALPPAALAEAKIQQFKADQQHSSLDEAQKFLASAESLNPDSGSVRLIAGLLHRTRGQYDEALKDYSRVLELEPRNADAYLRMASVYDDLNEPAKAIANYQQAIALQPEYYRPYQELGVFYYRRGEYGNAAVQFRNAIARAPGLYDAHTYLGAALNYLGQDAAAEQALRTSLSIKETPRALNSLGALQAYRRQDSQAAEYYERAVKLSPNNMIYLLNLGDSTRRSGRGAAARSAYERGMDLALSALNDDARDGLTRAYVAYFAARLGDGKRAQEEIAQARALAPEDIMVTRKTVLTYVALGRFDRALDSLQRAPASVVQELDRHPDLADLHRDPRYQQLIGPIVKRGK